VPTELGDERIDKTGRTLALVHVIVGYHLPMTSALKFGPTFSRSSPSMVLLPLLANCYESPADEG
jgi:hypothetical protein